MQFFEIKRNTQEMTEKTETTQTEKNQKPTSAKQNFLKNRIIITQIKKTRFRVFFYFVPYLLNISSSLRASRLCVSFPPIAAEIEPVSSETTMAIAS